MIFTDDFSVDYFLKEPDKCSLVSNLYCFKVRVENHKFFIRFIAISVVFNDEYNCSWVKNITCDYYHVQNNFIIYIYWLTYLL